MSTEAARRRDLALFDFDGTLTTREMLPYFFRRAIPRPKRWFGTALLAPLIVGYRLGWVPGLAPPPAHVVHRSSVLSFTVFLTPLATSASRRARQAAAP